MGNTISACLIIKNEIDNIKGLVADLREFCDEIAITDTGSTDGTLEWLNENSDDVLKVYHFNWIEDFSAARNASFTHATKDWIFWCDADDRLPEEFINEINRIKHNELPLCQKLIYTMNYDYDPVHNITVNSYRLIRKDTLPNWVCACHEYLEFGRKIKEDEIGYVNPDIMIKHQKENKVSSVNSYFETATHRNLQIYLSELLQVGRTVYLRDVFNYARELHNVNLDCFREAKYKVAESLIEKRQGMYYTDLWNCIMLLLHDKLISSKENAEHGIELINKIEEVTKLRADVFYFREHLKHIVNPKYNLVRASRETLKIKPVDPVDQFLERFEYSKVLPSINIYIKTKDKAEKEKVLNIIKQYVNEIPKANEFINSLKENK